MTTPINTGKSFDQLADEFSPAASQLPAVADPLERPVPAGFDPEAYFNRRFGATDTNKIQALREASANKMARLEQFRQELAGTGAQLKAEQEAQAKTWVNKLHLDPKTGLGEAVNTAASLVSGASRQVVGAIASLPHSLAAGSADANITQPEIDAYNRYQTGEASPEDIALLNTPKSLAGQSVTGFAAAKGGMSATSGQSTPMDLIGQANAARKVARNINDFFDISSIVDQTRRHELDQALGKDFQVNWDKVSAGVKGTQGDEFTIGTKVPGLQKAGNVPVSGMTYQPGDMVSIKTDKGIFVVPTGPGTEAQDNFAATGKNFGQFNTQKEATDYIQGLNKQAIDAGGKLTVPAFGGKKSFLERSGDVVSGIAGLLVNAGEAAVTNPLAVTEYAAENLPQLFVGAVGKIGKAAMAASNVGYAADYYQQGMENFQKNHNGELPSADQRNTIALWAASLAVAEHAGDHIALSAAKVPGAANAAAKAVTGVGEGATNMATDAAAKEAVKQGFMQSLKRTAVAGVEGGVGETITEGYQGYAENKAALKADATPFEIYQQAVIGGLSGHALSSGGHAVAEIAKATPEHQAERQMTVDQAKVFNEAAVQNDPSNYLDPKHADYSPTKGIGVLYAHNQLASTTTETKQQNIERAADVMNTLYDQYDALVEQKKTASPKDQAGLVRQFKELQDHINTGEKLVEQMVSNNNPIQSEEDIKQQVAQANTAVTEESTQAADQVINLSMQNTGNLSAKQADALSGNQDNSLTTGQREYLRAYSAARQSEDQLTNMNKVSQTVYYGDEKGNLGIAQYRQRLGNAVVMNDKAQADRALSMLSSFADVHSSKAAAATQAIKTSGLGAQIMRGPDGMWQVADREYTQKEVSKSAGQIVTLNSGRLVSNMQIEAKALTNAKVEAQALVGLHFENKSVQSGSPATENIQATSPNKSTQETVEPSARPEGKPSEPTKTDTPPKVEQTSEVQPEVAANGSESRLQANPTAAEDVNNKVDKEQIAAAERAKPYQERNLIAAYFTQTAGKTTGSTRPLVEIPGFLKSLASDTSNALLFLKEKVLTEQQDTMLRVFAKTATDWAGTIAKNVLPAKDPAYRYRDMSQFLLNDKGQFEENTQTAIAYGAFSWLAENASRSLFNTDEEINTILGKGEDALITAEAEALLRNAGTRENVVINALGQRVAQALGLTARADAPRNLAPQLESALGAHALKLLLDQGILERNTLSGQEMAGLMGAGTNENASFKFIKVKTDADGKMTAGALAVLEAMKGTQGVLDKLFGAEAGMKDPASSKIPFTQQSPRNTDQKVPRTEAEIMAHENAQPNHVRLDMWHLMGQLHPEVALAIAGFESINEDTTHVVNKASIQAKNDGLQREYDHMMEFFSVLQNEDRLEDPLFFEHTVWKQQRVGISTNTVNPQTSKLHRRMLSRPSWNVTISFSDKEAIQNFKLRVAEGLGVKTDKQDNEKSLADAVAAINQPEIKAAVKVLRKAMNEGGITRDEQNTLLAGVQAGGEAMHTLDALVAVAHYMDALEGGKNEFNTQLMGEVDGVTNGPMLSHLLMGAAPDVNSLFQLLNRGGFYEVGNEQSQYNQWRSQPGNQDLYEITSAHMVEAIKGMAIPAAQAAAIYAFTGTLVKDDKVTKEGRNIIKTPLTAMIFGSSVSSAVDSMADKFVESVYGKMEDVAAGKADRAQLLRDLKTLGVQLNPNTSVKELMSTPLTPAQIGRLKDGFKDTIGKAVAQTMKQDFATFIESRRTFNLTAQAAYALYNAAYTGLREQRIAELVKSGDIAVNKTTGKPLHDLTNKQEEQLRKDVQEILPLMHTAFSQQSNQLDAGLMASKSARKISTRQDYSGEIKFGSPFPDGPSSVKTAAYERSETAPGVAMAPMSVHATDSFISHMAAMKSEVLNIHDAHGAGLANFQQAARNLNQATWEAMLTYSPATQMADTLTRVVQGIAAMQEAGKLPEQSQKLIQQVLAELGAQLEVDPRAALDMQMKAARDLAYRADDMKLQAMEQMQAVDQYALEGGNYVVTDADRKAAKAARVKLDMSVQDDAAAALTTLASLASGEIKAQVQKDNELDPKESPTPSAPKSVVPAALQNTPGFTPWGELGAPAIESNQHLVDAFNATPTMQPKRALQVLREALNMGEKNRSTAFALQLTNLLEKALPAGTTIQMVTPATPASEVLAKGADKSRGWYVSKGDANAIYVLSPDFKYSGLTPEVLLHEMTHGALARTVQAELDAKAKDAAYTSPALDLVNELESLRTLAEKYLTENKLTQFAPAVANVHELISWGMSNLEFQRQVLNKVSMKSTTTGNKLVMGMKRFIETLTGLLFKGSTKTAAEQAENGMAVLIANVSGVFHTAIQTRSKADLVLNQMNTAGQATPHIYSTTEIFDALAGVHTSSTVSPGFGVQLKSLLQGIVDTLHGPFGTLREAQLQQAATTPQEAFANALLSGKAPFASASLASGFKISEQEAFVMEQVEASMRAALASNEGHTTAAYQELAKLYQEVSAKLKVEDFHPGDWAQATPTEKAEAQALHDFLFKLDQKADQKSDYLARFAALGLANEQVATLLKFATDVKTDRQLAGLSFTEKLHAIYDMVLSWLNGQFTHTFEGQQADEKLEQLVQDLVGIEAKKIMKIQQQGNKTIEHVEDLLEDLAAKGRDKIETFGRSAFFRTSNSAFVKAIGTAASAVAGDRVHIIMDGITQLRDQHFKERYGLLAGIVNEIRGSKPDNLMFHKLLRTSKHIEGQRKDILTNTAKFVMESFDKGGEYLTKEHQAAIAQTVLRTDAASLLNGYSVQDTLKLLGDEKFRTAEIARLASQLTGVQHFGHYFVKAAKQLGYYKATGRVVGANLMFNAGNIASLYGTQYAGRISASQVAKVTPAIDHLVTLYALSYLDSKHKPFMKEVLDTEGARGNENGLEMVLKLHQSLQQQSKDRLFVAGEPLFMKGYVPELYNPYIELRAATEEDGEGLVAQGFVQGPAVQSDFADPNRADKHIYMLRDGGLQAHLTGIFSYTGRKAKGSQVISGGTNLLSAVGQQNQQTMNDIALAKQPMIRDMFRADPGFDPRKVGDAHMAPVLNAVGDVVNYRYMMAESTKDNLLERNNDFSQLLGTLAGNIFDKQMTVEQNATAVQALKDQFDQEFHERSAAYVRVGKDATDPEMREIWRLLPESTKQSIRDIWGGNNMMVRRDLLDINFGYRKLSIADTFTKDAGERNAVERILFEVGTFFFGEKARLRFKQGEDIWQAFVREAKDTMVVKSGVTLMGNISSNLTELMWFGVPVKDILRHHRVAMKGALAYRKESEQLERINLQLSTGYLPATSQADLQRQKIILEDSLARNPVRELIDAGLMPTIVEDVAADDDQYSFKGRFTRKVDEFVGELNPHVVNTAKTLMIAHDTPLYRVLSYGTQLSDFVARYTLYMHMTERQKNPMPKEEAIQLVSDAFINYDVPSHRLLQYANDTGLIYFSKYYLRIQKVITHLYKENPGRALMLLTASHFFDGIPTLMDSAAIHRIGNPFSTGALKYVTTLDEMATVNSLMTPFK